MNNDIKSLAPKVIEVIAKEITAQANKAQPISIKATKEKVVKALLEEINRVFPDGR